MLGFSLFLTDNKYTLMGGKLGIVKIKSNKDCRNLGLPLMRLGDPSNDFHGEAIYSPSEESFSYFTFSALFGLFRGCSWMQKAWLECALSCSSDLWFVIEVHNTQCQKTHSCTKICISETFKPYY